MKMIAAIAVGLLIAGCDDAYAAGHGPLTAENGMTLYTFDNDSAGTSNCYDSCATSWPPYLAEADAEAPAGFTVVERRDGERQWAKDDAPLYFWVGDSTPGDINGDGIGGVWHLAN
jgi:predicted lipoprotein with Yx(FWY)xxD motif